MWSTSQLQPDIPPLPCHLPPGTSHIPVQRNAPSSIPSLQPHDVTVFTCNDFSDAHSAGREARQLIDSHIMSKGAVLLRGLQPLDANQASSFVNGLGYKRQPYEPFAGRRDKLLDLDLSTTRTKKNKLIPSSHLMDVHNEVSYNPRPCLKIALLCIQPASVSGGESLLVNARDLTASIPPYIINSFEANGGILYERIYHDGSNPAPRPPSSCQSWQERTGCQDKEGAESFWREEMGCNVEWFSNGTMRVWNVQSVLAHHPRSSAAPSTAEDPRPPDQDPPLWFNLAHVPIDSRYGNGRPVEAEVIEALVKIRWQHVRYLSLEEGDVLVLDNYLWLHGRMPFDGTRFVATILTRD